ncbi:MFS transporter [Nonomuraea sp. NPDC050536]|uniref:MFS transporter n=1 Tax=Nonomuraea sp. NPDC050536 TaxID=3364366 RepID=UPI0037CC2BB7
MTTRLLVGRSVSALATALIPTTLTLAVLRATGSAQALGLVLACELLPMLVLLPVGGVLADRFRPERVALAADLVRGLTQVAIGVELLLGVTRIPDLAVLSGVAGVAVAFGSPAVPRLVVAVVQGPDRLRVNARIGVATSLSGVVAPAISGGLVLVAGPGWAALLTAVLFACSAMTLGGVRTARPQRHAETASFGRDLVEGWREVRRRPWFLTSVLGHGVWHFMAGLFLTLGPLMAVSSLGGESSWVLIVQCGTVGLVAGVFMAPRLPILRPRNRPAIGRGPTLRIAIRENERGREGVGSMGRKVGAVGREDAAQGRGRGLGVGAVGEGGSVGAAGREGAAGQVSDDVAGVRISAVVRGVGAGAPGRGGEGRKGAGGEVERPGEARDGVRDEAGAGARDGVRDGAGAGARDGVRGGVGTRRALVVVQACAALYVLPMAALAVPLPAWGIAVAYAGAMFGLGLLSPLWETVVANEIPEHALGRVRSFDQLISFASRPFGLAVAAPLAGLAGVTTTMVVGGVLVAVANLATILGIPAAQESSPVHAEGSPAH